MFSFANGAATQGNDFTFDSFPAHLKDTVANNLPDHEVASAIYPKYETRGELTQSTAAFLEWYCAAATLVSHVAWTRTANLTDDRLKERVMELRKAHLDNPWPPNDRRVGVVLVAHSMG
jgi:hypothetical protein